MIDAAQEQVLLVAFTLDVRELVTPLQAARKRGCVVRLMVDYEWATGSRCRNMRVRLAQLAANGCDVLVGPSSQRIHQKSLLCDRTLWIGSTNWTDASQRNIERGLGAILSRAQRQKEEAEFRVLVNSAVSFREAPETSSRLPTEPSHDTPCR